MIKLIKYKTEKMTNNWHAIEKAGENIWFSVLVLLNSRIINNGSYVLQNL